MALRNIYQSAPIIWVAEWSPIVQGRPKNTIYQDYLMMRLIHDAQIENKVPLKILGIELVFACRGWLLHLNCGTNLSRIFLAWKSPNCVHIITKMAVKPVYTYHAEKNLPCGALYRIFNTYITNKTVVLFFHHTETYYAKPNLI